MSDRYRRKLIEVSIPLEAINKACAREKSIRHGHPSTLHLWWARRPLAACRAVLFAQLVDDPSAWPERFPTGEAQDTERKRLHKVIERLVPWEASNNEEILNEARWEIARSVAWGLMEEPPAQGDGPAILTYLQAKAPPVYDPFSGGGSIPLEAQRLGLRAYGSDLNPVAVLIGKALVEIPPKFTGCRPVNPKANAEVVHGDVRAWRGAQGLAEDVRYYGHWIRGAAEKRIGHLYPKVKLSNGSRATVIAWLWARTVRSPDPVAQGAMVPLVSSFMLSTKHGKMAWVDVVIDPNAPDGYRFEVNTGTLTRTDEERLKKGTKAGHGQGFTCVRTGSVIERSYVQLEGKADRLGARLLAVVAEGTRSRIYQSPCAEDEAIADSAKEYSQILEGREVQLSAATPTRAQLTGGVCSAYGLRTWGHLFTDRQIVALTTLTELIGAAREAALYDALSAGMSDDPARLRDDGIGASAYADAIATYLALSVSRQVNRGCTLNFWDNTSQKIQQVFGRQAFAMTWDFAETNFFSNSTGNFSDQVEYPVKSIAGWSGGTAKGFISQIDAPNNSFPVRPVIISTDPPYYDNIGYATLADFFYVWLRPSLGSIWPTYFGV
jgi:putative DNA methylase